MKYRLYECSGKPMDSGGGLQATGGRAAGFDFPYTLLPAT
jgi:hypothetical protein